MNKYQPLTDHLKSRQASQYPITFKEIESLIGDALPPSAYRHRAWWSNNPSNSVMTKAWLEAGWISTDVDIEDRKLVFRRKSNPATHTPPTSGQAATSPSGHRIVIEDISEQTFTQLKARAGLTNEPIEKIARRVLVAHANLTPVERLAIADQIRAAGPSLHDTDVVAMIRQDRDAR